MKLHHDSPHNAITTENYSRKSKIKFYWQKHTDKKYTSPSSNIGTFTTENYSRKSKISIPTENYSCKSKIKFHWQKHTDKNYLLLKKQFYKSKIKFIAQRKCIYGKHTPYHSFITPICSWVNGKTLVLGFLNRPF